MLKHFIFFLHCVQLEQDSHPQNTIKFGSLLGKLLQDRLQVLNFSCRQQQGCPIDIKHMAHSSWPSPWSQPSKAALVFQSSKHKNLSPILMAFILLQTQVLLLLSFEILSRFLSSALASPPFLSVPRYPSKDLHLSLSFNLLPN